MRYILRIIKALLILAGCCGVLRLALELIILFPDDFRYAIYGVFAGASVFIISASIKMVLRD